MLFALIAYVKARSIAWLLRKWKVTGMGNVEHGTHRVLFYLLFPYPQGVGMEWIPHGYLYLFTLPMLSMKQFMCIFPLSTFTRHVYISGLIQLHDSLFPSAYHCPFIEGIAPVLVHVPFLEAAIKSAITF